MCCLRQLQQHALCVVVAHEKKKKWLASYTPPTIGLNYLARLMHPRTTIGPIGPIDNGTFNFAWEEY